MADAGSNPLMVTTPNGDHKLVARGQSVRLEVSPLVRARRRGRRLRARSPAAQHSQLGSAISMLQSAFTFVLRSRPVSLTVVSPLHVPLPIPRKRKLLQGEPEAEPTIT